MALTRRCAARCCTTSTTGTFCETHARVAEALARRLIDPRILAEREREKGA